MQTYQLNAEDQRQYEALGRRIADHGGLYRLDSAGNPVLGAAGAPVALEYVILPSRRYLVDARGVLWRFFAEGTPKHADGRGTPWRNNRVEMWTGRWCRTVGPDGTVAWTKQLVARPIEKRINGRPGMSNIDWYLNVKGYKHPLDGPDTPPESPDPKTAATPPSAPAGDAPSGSPKPGNDQHGARSKHR